MEQAIRRFLDQLQYVHGSSENTIIAYRTDLNQFNSVIAAGAESPVTIHNIHASSLQSYTIWLNEQGYQATTISRKMAAVRTFVEYLIAEEGLVGFGYTQILKPPPAPRRKPLTLTSEEVEQLLSAPSTADSAGGLRDSAILHVLYETAFRAAEMVELRLSDVDLYLRQIHRPGSPSEPLQIESSLEPLRLYLLRGRPHLLKDPNENRIFLNQRGQGLSRQGLWLVVKRWGAAAGLSDRLSPNTLRHTRARELLESGISRREVQDYLGLSSPNAIRYHRQTYEEVDIEIGSDNGLSDFGPN